MNLTEIVIRVAIMSAFLGAVALLMVKAGL